MKLYQLGKGVCKYYRERVKGNEGLSQQMIQRKLTRNIALAIKVPVRDDQCIYLYGNLHIHTKGNVITKIRNYHHPNDWFYLDRQKKCVLNKILGIDNQKSQWNEVGNLDYIDEYAKGFVH